MRALVFIFSFLFVLTAFGQNTPERFLTHKVKKKETLYGLARKYNISIDQIKEYNPLIEKIGLKKRMELKIPVYPIIQEPKAVPLKEGLTKYLVQPKETKWRLAYRYCITIHELEQLNPQIKVGLKIGQEIVIPKRTVEETIFDLKVTVRKAKLWRYILKITVTASKKACLEIEQLSIDLHTRSIVTNMKICARVHHQLGMQ